MARILVTDGEERSALAVARSLGRAGHEVTVTSATGQSLSGASRFVRMDVALPRPLEEPERYLDRLADLCRQRSIEVLIPIADASLLPILADRERFAPARIPFPAFDQVRRIGDKAALLAAAPKVGISVPRQIELRSRTELATLEAPVPFPVVIKPWRSVVSNGKAQLKVGVSYADDAAELARRVAQYPDGAFPLLLQQRIVGPGVGVFLLIWGGELRAISGHRRLREKPPSGGVSVYRESIVPDSVLVQRSLALLQQFEWEGVAMIEYKLDAATGTPYLMEVNGRFWGSLQLAIDAGVDFPTLLLAALFEKSQLECPTCICGIRSRWWWGDVDHLIARLRHSNAALALPPGSPSRLRALLDFLVLWRPGDRNEILKLYDPGPFLRETRDWFRQL